MPRTVTRPENVSIRAILQSSPSRFKYESARGKMLELVRRARRRLLNSELIAQGANAFSAALAAFILLLIVGAQILDWYWLALIPAAAAAAGIYLAVRRLPSPYRTAQLVDHRAQLADTLSTALYFSNQSASASPEILRWQQQRAEEAARQVDLARTLPYSMPRSAYIVAALALVATSLFALRYGLSRRLDLNPPLARMIWDQFTPADKKEVAENRRRTPPGKDDTDTNDSANQDQAQNQQGQDQQDADNPSDQGDSKNADKSGDAKDQAGKQTNADQSQDGQSQNQQADDQNQQDSGQQSSASQGESKGDPKQQSDGKQNNGNSGESGSLLSKMKDFAENLLSKMKPQPQNANNQQQQSASQNSKQGQGQQQKGQQQNSKDGQQGASDQADAQQGQNGDEKDGQQSQGKGSGDKSQQANKQPGSGVGSEDGDKAIKRAEQLAAMGKITELIGKRSATVTGESTVEVQNTSQQLHTAYVQRGAQHQQSGAQIDRDEVPVALQPYVEQYFDQVRKQPPAVAPATPKKQ